VAAGPGVFEQRFAISFERQPSRRRFPLVASALPRQEGEEGKGPGSSMNRLSPVWMWESAEAHTPSARSEAVPALPHHARGSTNADRADSNIAS